MSDDRTKADKAWEAAAPAAAGLRLFQIEQNLAHPERTKF
jgi:hypothetical protein